MEMITELILDAPPLAHPVIEATPNVHQRQGTVDIERHRGTPTDIRPIAAAASELVDRTTRKQADALCERPG